MLLIDQSFQPTAPDPDLLRIARAHAKRGCLGRWVDQAMRMQVLEVYELDFDEVTLRWSGDGFTGAGPTAIPEADRAVYWRALTTNEHLQRAYAERGIYHLPAAALRWIVPGELDYEVVAALPLLDIV